MATRMAKTHRIGARVSSVLFLVPFLIGAGFSSAADPIVEAAKEGDVATVRQLIESGADVNVAEGDGMTSLHWAAGRGYVEVTRLLLEAGADVAVGTWIGTYTPLHLAVRGGHTAVSKLLIEAGADITAATTNSGVTPLHLAAAAEGGEDIVAALIGAGADVNAKESVAGQTPLMFAASYGRTESVERLLAAGADAAVTTRVVDALEQLRTDLGAGAALREELAPRMGTPSSSQVQAAIGEQRALLSDGGLGAPELDLVSALVGPGSERGGIWDWSQGIPREENGRYDCAPARGSRGAHRRGHGALGWGCGRQPGLSIRRNQPPVGGSPERTLRSHASAAGTGRGSNTGHLHRSRDAAFCGASDALGYRQ